MIITIDVLSSKYQVHRATDPDTEKILEFVTTELGAGYCISIAGTGLTTLTSKADKDTGTVMPLMAIRERVPVKTQPLGSTPASVGDGENETQKPVEVDTYQNVIVYKNYFGQWGTTLNDVTKNIPSLSNDIPALTNAAKVGIHFLVQKPGDTYEWEFSEDTGKVRCPTSRGLYYARKGLISVSSQLYRLIKFFDDAQAKPNKNETVLDETYYKCQPTLRSLPRVVNLALADSIDELNLKKSECTQKLMSLFDAALFLARDRPFSKKDKNRKIKPHPRLNKRSIWDLIGPSYDYAPIYSTLRDLRDNLVHNHLAIEDHATRMQSLEKLTIDETQHIRLLASLHNLDVYSRDVVKASLQNLENMRYVKSIMQEAVNHLESEAVLLANSIHYDASCFANPSRTVSCAKDVPRVNFTASGTLIIEYYSESIKLESRPYYTCLPTKYGLSYKHHHYAVQVSGGAILLNNGHLIMNATDKESFFEDYDGHIASIESCYFNVRTGLNDQHIYLNCIIDTDLQYKGDRGRMEMTHLKPYQLQRVNFNQFPITIRSQTLELSDIMDKQDIILFDDMYAKVTREAWYSALHLPRALVEYRTKTKQHEYWSDVAKLAIKYPKVRHYFTISLVVMSLTALGIIAACAIKYRVNIFNCCVFLYSCCRPKPTSELRRPPILKRPGRGRRQSQSPDTSGSEGKVRSRVRDLETASRSRRRSRSRTRSRSRSRRSGRASSPPLPSYREASTALLQDNSTQVRDKYASRPRT